MLRCQCRDVRALTNRSAHSPCVPSAARSSFEPSRSSSLERPPDSKTGLVWRARSQSMGPESVLDFRSGQSSSLGGRQMPPGLGLDSAQYGRLGREQPFGAGEVCVWIFCTTGCHVSQPCRTVGVNAAVSLSACCRSRQAGESSPTAGKCTDALPVRRRAQASRPGLNREGPYSGRLGSESLMDPMLARMVLDPVPEPASASIGGSFTGVPLAARESYSGFPPMQTDGAHPALASRRAISDTPDALNAALPQHSPSRLGR